MAATRCGSGSVDLPNLRFLRSFHSASLRGASAASLSHESGCSVRTSIKVRHYVPDAVVSSYSNTGQNPWIEVRPMSPPTPSAQAGGDGTTNEDHENNLAKFKNADVIGHPGGQVFSQFASASGYICQGAGTAFMPYLLSTFDTLAYVGSAIAALGAALVGAWIPARRAASVGPLEALRRFT